MKIADIRAKTEDEMKDQLIQLKKEQFNMRFQRAAGQLESVGRVRLVRRDVARIKTVMAEIKRNGGSEAGIAAPKKAKAAPKKAVATKKAGKK